MYSIQDLNKKILCGHALTELKKFPDESINCVITSPPYWSLRDYDTNPLIWDGDENCKHIWSDDLDIKQVGRIRKHTTTDPLDKQVMFKNHSNFCKCGAWRGSLGLEPNFKLYLIHLFQIFKEIKRVLKKSGSCWVNIGDSYSNSGKGGDSEKPYAKRHTEFGKISDIRRHGKPTRVKDLPPKCLCQIPERFAIGMVDQLGFTKRNTIIWQKNNVMPASMKDRFTVDFEYFYFFTKDKNYYFEQQFEEYLKPMDRWGGQILKAGGKSMWDEEAGHSIYRNRDMRPNSNGRNKRTVWSINTVPYKEAHFAIFPEALILTPIKACCPEYICVKCGTARKKIFKQKVTFHSGSGKSGIVPKGKWEGGEQEVSGDYDIRMGPHIERIDKGYTDCGCNVKFESGIVLDPFVGAGTTLLVAEKLDRRWIGIELNSEYVKIAQNRIDPIRKQIKLF